MKKILKVIGKSIVAIFALLCVLIFVQLFILDKILYPDDVYVKMAEINDKKTIIGLSEEEVIELLGKPDSEYIDIQKENNYIYFAGATIKKSFFSGEYGRKVYELLIDFDRSGKVEYTYMKECP